MGVQTHPKRENDKTPASHAVTCYNIYAGTETHQAIKSGGRERMDETTGAEFKTVLRLFKALLEDDKVDKVLEIIGEELNEK